MEVVLPGSWSDVATKRDLDQLRYEMDLRFDQMVTKAELQRELRTLALSVITVNAAVVSLGLAVAQAL